MVLPAMLNQCGAGRGEHRAEGVGSELEVLFNTGGPAPSDTRPCPERLGDCIQSLRATWPRSERLLELQQGVLHPMVGVSEQHGPLAHPGEPFPEPGPGAGRFASLTGSGGQHPWGHGLGQQTVRTLSHVKGNRVDTGVGSVNRQSQCQPEAVVFR